MQTPNIILIYPDQMRFDATSFSGNTVVHTPSFDSLAKSGAYFENAYASIRDRVLTPDGTPGTNYYCSAYRSFFSKRKVQLMHAAQLICDK